jgi:surface antigen
MRPDRRLALSLVLYTGNVRALKKACGTGLICAQAALAFALGGCSVSMPMGSLISGSHDDDETGTITPSPLGGLEGKDWQQAKVALDSALASQSAGTVPWENSDSGVRGSFAAVGNAYTSVEGTCRGFHAAIDRNDEDDQLQGTACSAKAGDWQITDVKPLNKS